MDENRGYVVLTAVGSDRTGLVDELSILVGEAGANIEDSRMAILGGEFAVIMLLSVSADAIDRTRQIGPQVERELGLSCLLKETSPPTRPPSTCFIASTSPAWTGRASCTPSPESSPTATSTFASLESRLTHAPFSATPMFVLEAELQVPSKTVLSELRHDLAATCEEENLDFRLELA